MTSELDPWRTFWLASELSAVTGPAFATRINDFAPPESISRFTYPHAAVALERADDAFSRVVGARASTRAFATGGALPARDLGAVFSALADTPGGRRAWPAAGGLYAVEAFAFLLAVDHPHQGRIVHYEPNTHGLTAIGDAPAWDDLVERLGGQALESAPDLAIVLVVDAEQATAKYGNRGGRFALLEAGHAAENVALRLAASGLAGCELGGAYDRDVLGLLGLRTTDAFVALAYAVGRPVPTERERPRRGVFPFVRR